MNPLLPIFALGGGALLLLGGGGKKPKGAGKKAADKAVDVPAILPPAPTEPPTDKPSPANTRYKEQIAEIVINALKTRDPQLAEAAAASLDAMQPFLTPELRELARQGAQSLREQAAEWRAEREARQAPPAVFEPGGPTAPPKRPPPPPREPAKPVPVPKPAPIPTPAPKERTAAQKEWAKRKKFAQALATHLMPYTRYKERRDMVTAFQKQEGLKPDGWYGVDSGLAFLKYGVVPAKPYYFSKNKAKTRADKARWTAELTRMAQQDPARANLWMAQSKVDNL